VRARIVGPEVVVSVSDSGPGLAAGEEARIFEKLYRGSASGMSEERGAGLGLAIVQAIATAHGGRAWAENRPEGGATFSISLPLGDSPPDIAAMEQAGTGQ
jgi:two-component system sensor histidine kinase KdpD